VEASVTLETDRLRLEPLRVDDAVEMAVVLADPALYEFTGGAPPSVNELATRYGYQVAGRSADGTEVWANWIARLAGEGTAIGFVQATITGGGGAADVGWVIGVPWQGRGLATEAGRALLGWLDAAGVERVTAHIHPGNAPSARMAAALGFVVTSGLVDGEQVWERPAGR
jgi:RimJ/RimL family protein N-acetyltransferase